MGPLAALVHCFVPLEDKWFRRQEKMLDRHFLPLCSTGQGMCRLALTKAMMMTIMRMQRVRKFEQQQKTNKCPMKHFF